MFYTYNRRLNDVRVTCYALLPAHVTGYAWAHVSAHVHLGNKNVCTEYSLKGCVLAIDPSTYISQEYKREQNERSS
jgi:hypothetical protein